MTKTFVIILAAIAVVVLAVGIPNFIRARSTTASNFYVNSLRQIEGAKNEWMIETGKTTNDAPTWAELLPYLIADLQTIMQRMEWLSVRRVGFIQSGALVSRHLV
jgi:hypothetical protein